MLKPWIDAMSVNPSGGHALFPVGNSPVSQNVSPTNTFLTEMSSKQGTGAGSQPSGSHQQAAPTGATSQSPTGSQGSDSPGNLSVDSERESRELEPIIYQEVSISSVFRYTCMYMVVLAVLLQYGELTM